MKKLKKFLALLLLPVLLLSLNSCQISKANLYNKWKIGGTEYISKAHVFEQISFNDLLGKVKAQGKEEKLYVFYGTPTSSASQSAIGIYNEQAIQYQISKVYWLDSVLNDNDLKKISSDQGGILGVNDPKTVPAIFVFEGGAISFDSTLAKYKNDTAKYTTIKLAEIAFKGLYKEN